MNVTLAPASNWLPTTAPEGIKGDVGPCHGGGSGVELNVALAPAADWLLTAAFEGITGAVGCCHGKGSGVADEAPEDEGAALAMARMAAAWVLAAPAA